MITFENIASPLFLSATIEDKSRQNNRNGKTIRLSRFREETETPIPGLSYYRHFYFDLMLALSPKQPETEVPLFLLASTYCCCSLESRRV